MAGGIFPNYPFQLNIKCVIFSIIIISLFFYKPPNVNNYWKIFISLILFVVSYVAMAWYDYQFECQKLALKRGTSDKGLTQKFKPPIHTESQRDMSKATKEENTLELYLIHFYHILVITPLLLYIGIHKNKTNPNLFIVVVANLLFALLYHLPRMLRKMNLVSLGHVILAFVGSYLSLMNTKPDWYFTSLIGLSGYIGFKHGYQVMKLSHLF